jgi:hypothetical protein
MNNLKTYNEYLNEGIYDWMNREMLNPVEMIAGISLTLSIIVSPVILIGLNFNIISIIIASFIGLPVAVLILKELFRNPYNALRSKLFLKKANEINKNLKQYLDKYPDIEENLK